MRINWQGRIGRIKWSFRAGRITRVTGINSNLKDGRHIIMWEFDGDDHEAVYLALCAAADRYELPPISIVRSHPDGGFHAYCFYACDWLEAIHIVSGTPGVDPGYVSMCAMRGHWTLRLSDKGQGPPMYCCTIRTRRKPTADRSDLCSIVNYEAWPRGSVWAWGERGV